MWHQTRPLHPTPHDPKWVQKKSYVRMEQEGGSPQARNTLTRNQICWHLEHGLQTSRTVRNKVCCLNQSMIFYYGSPSRIKHPLKGILEKEFLKPVSCICNRLPRLLMWHHIMETWCLSSDIEVLKKSATLKGSRLVSFSSLRRYIWNFQVATKELLWYLFVPWDLSKIFLAEKEPQNFQEKHKTLAVDVILINIKRF